MLNRYYLTKSIKLSTVFFSKKKKTNMKVVYVGVII